jgi:MHS family alpha-ketoglutarate permease-like MFS transporter
MLQQQLYKKELSVRGRIQAIIGGSIGNLVEWYDWYAYAALPFTFQVLFSRMVIKPHSC